MMLLPAGLLLALLSCTYDVEEELNGNTPTACTTANVTYSGTITPILQSNGCFNCYNTGLPSGGVNLQGHSNVRAQAVNGPLLGSISHSPGFTPMPLGGNKLSPCDISKVKTWIDAGSPNN